MYSELGARQARDKLGARLTRDKLGVPQAWIQEVQGSEETSVMLDRFIFRRDGGVKPLPVNLTTAGSSTCVGVPFRVSLDLVPASSTSRFYLEWPGGPDPDATVPCHLVGVHRGCVLFRLTSIARTRSRPQELIFPDDYYIYRPATADLKRLPTCIRSKVIVAEERDQDQEQEKDRSDLISELSSESESELLVTKEMELADKIHREQYEKKLAMGVFVDEEVVRSSLLLENIAFCCCKNDDEFVVAELLLDKQSPNVSAEISILRSRSWEWVSMPLPIHCNNKHDSAALYCFCPQSAVPFGDCLCWVDHRTGIIIGEIMLDTPKLSFVPFPRMNPSRLGDDLRSVCATDGGSSLKFVDIVVDKQPRSTGFTINVYRLIISEEGCVKWEKETSITSAEMWGLKAPGRIPHEVPTFPLVSLDEPHIVHVQLSECTDYIDTVTLVSIDMTAPSVISVHTHIKGEQELHGVDADVAEARTLLPLPFLPATFSKFLIRSTNVLLLQETY